MNTQYLIDAETLDVIRQATVGEYARSLTAKSGYIVADGRRCYVDTLLVTADNNDDNDNDQQHGTETMNNANDAIATSYILRDTRTDAIVEIMPANWHYPSNDGKTYVQAYTHQLIDSETMETIRPATISELQASLAAGPEGHILIDGKRCFVD